MVANILLEGQNIPATGVLRLQINQQIEINISAEEVQRKVSRFTHMEISTQLHAETATLVVGDRVVWRVPIHLTFPLLGDVGCVGFIEIDPITGELEVSKAILKEIEQNADHLASRFALSTAHPG